MSRILKRAVGVILLVSLLISSMVTPAICADMINITELDLSGSTIKKIYFKGETNKDFATYEINEEKVFTVTLWADMDGDSNRDNDTQLSAPYFAYSIKGDDGKSTSGFVDASSGQATIKTSLSCAGAVRLTIDPANAEKVVISNSKITQFVGGAMAAASEIQVTTGEPEDFDEFWRAQLAELDAVAPELLYIKELDSAKSGFKAYEVRIACVDDTCPTVTGNTYVAAFMSIPDNAEKGKMGIDIRYNGYGTARHSVEYKSGYIFMNVNAHSIPLDREDSFYTDLEKGVLKKYGWSQTENADPKTSYFRNMILRDLQALRFLEKYFCTEGVASTVDGVDTSAWAGLWDGERISLRGSSQGGFQSIAVAALAPEVTEVYADIPWFADVAGRTDKNKIPSTYLPTYVEGLHYYDSALFAKRIKAPYVAITAGTGDDLCPMAGVQGIYNNLKNDSAQITFTQGRAHGGTNTYPINSVQMRSESPVITGKIDSQYTKVEWEFNIATKVLTIASTVDSGWNETGNVYSAGSWNSVANQIEEVVIVGKISKISGNAFLNHDKLRKVTTSKTVTEIDSKAFSGCSSLNEVCISGDVSVPGAVDLSRLKNNKGNLAYGYNLFAGATSVKALILGNAYSDERPFVESNIPENLETIYGPYDSEYLRKYCAENGLKFVPFGKASPSTVAWTYDEAKKTVTIIGNGAIDSITDADATFLASAENLVLNAGITELGSDVFAGLAGLKSVTISGNAPKTSVCNQRKQ